ncbi:MAG: metal-dependent hydrolase [Nanoarchaeota archaeon]|nr:metal-dependent hydrolase [Nanoarchaeota archaeon]MBU1631585.1 metal-dependent hydrolase [Nanoarchaeota archaeon]MBU1876119.1 metal-dependent hydrolase [Nanoarchaeota archaeon]
MVLFHTHILLGIIVFLFTKDFFSGGNQIIFFLMVLLGSILPDIDESKSKINQWSGIIGKIIAFFAQHRGFYHSLLFFVITFMSVSYLWSNYYAWGLLLGYLAHMFGDGITLMGVQIFYPFSKFKIKGPVKVGGMVESVILIFLVILIVKKFL